MDDDLARDWSFIPSPRSGLRVTRAEGPYLYTDDGRRILDAAGGAIVANVGHGRPEVVAAVAKAMQETSYVVPPFITESRLRLLERIKASWLPADLTRVAFTSGGSESVEFALRLARHHHLAAGRPKRFKIIGRDLSYHGTTIATLAVGGHEKRRKGFEPLFVDSPRIPACYCLRCPLGRTYPDCGVACATELEAVIEREDPETIAAFIAEPIGGSTAGALTPPEEYWPTVAEICRRHGILLIADEVMTGFGRTGRRFAIEHWDLRPDILVGGTLETTKLTAELTKEPWLQGETRQIGRHRATIPDNPGIGYWFSPVQAAALAALTGWVPDSPAPTRDVLRLAISASIIRKWPKTISRARDIVHSRPHRIDRPCESFADQLRVFRLSFKTVMAYVKRLNEVAIVDEMMKSMTVQADSLTHLKTLSDGSIDYVLSSPPYFDAIDYPSRVL